jgi:hypothetical protein
LDFGKRARRKLVNLGFHSKLADACSKRDLLAFLDALDRERNQGLIRAGAFGTR